MPGALVSDLQDPRWELVQHIVSSPTFIRSEQLSKLLSYVCRMAILECFEQINEQNIGVAIFGRSPDYDSAADSIVRSHATRLRQKLEQYFRGPGRNEPLRVDIPRGGYVPRFYTAASAAASRELETASVVPENADSPADLTDPQPDLSAVTGETVKENRHRLDFRVSRLQAGKPSLYTVAALSALVTLILTAVLFIVVRHLRHDAELAAGSVGARQTLIERRFWETLFSANSRTIIVPGDAGLLLFETYTNHEVSLQDYIDGYYRSPDYLKNLTSEIPHWWTTDVAQRRYTSITDAEMAENLARLPEWPAAHAGTVFAQDLKPEEAETSNLILLGSRQSNPWITLVESPLNFVLVPDGARGFQYLNRAPLHGENKIYGYRPESGDSGGDDIYANIAYLPNPEGKGMVLLLSGMWTSGTQAAGKFVLDSPRFSAWLQSIARPDGTIPPFEMLLATKIIQGNATATRIAVERVHSEQMSAKMHY